jgi:HEAT repeat protein
LKFLFSRLDEPSSPDWQSDTADWDTVANGTEAEHPDLWESQWDWYYGKQNGTTNGVSPTEVDNLLETLQNENEKLRLNAAYRLGRVGAAAVPALKKALHSTHESIQNYAGYALSLAGPSAVSTLIDGLQNTDDTVRSTAAYALADIGLVAAEAVPALTDAAKDVSPLVRRHAIEGIGIIGQQMDEDSDLAQTVQVLTEGLSDEHYWIRYNAARSLAKLGPLSEPAIPILIEQLEDENRYVRFHAALALKQIDTHEAREVLFNHLFSTRWCALTTRETPY